MKNLSTAWAQLKQWPPTSSTVFGMALGFALLTFMLSGSLEFAVAIASIAKIVIPQDAPAIDRAIDEARQIATVPKA